MATKTYIFQIKKMKAFQHGNLYCRCHVSINSRGKMLSKLLCKVSDKVLVVSSEKRTVGVTSGIHIKFYCHNHFINSASKYVKGYRWSWLKQCMLNKGNNPSISSKGAIRLRVLYLSIEKISQKCICKASCTEDVKGILTNYPASLSHTNIIIMQMQNQAWDGSMYLRKEITTIWAFIGKPLLSWKVIPLTIIIKQVAKLEQ